MRRLLAFRLLALAALVLFASRTYAGPGVYVGPGGSGVQTYAPCNCARDTAALQAMISGAAAAKVREIQIGPGTVSVTAPISLASNLALTLHPLTVLSSTIAFNAGDVARAPLFTPHTTSGTTTALAAAALIGDVTLSTTASLATGTVCLGSSNTVQCLEARSVTGSGPYTLALTKPVRFAFASSTPIANYGVTHDLTINGNGALVTGTGSTGLEASFCNRCRFVGLNFSGSWVKGASLDVGSRDSGFEDVDSDTLLTAGAVPITFEGCVNCYGNRLRAQNAGAGAQSIWLNNVAGLQLRDVHVYVAASTTYGIQWDVSPSSGSRIVGGEVIGSQTGSAGIYLASTVSGVEIDGVGLRGVGRGIYLDSADDVSLSNIRAVDCYNGAIYAAGTGTYRVSNLSTTWSSSGAPYYELYGFWAAGTSDTTINGWTDAGAFYAALYVPSTTATVRVSGFRWSAGAQASWTGALITGASAVSLRGGTIDLGTAASSLGISVTAAAKMYLDTLTITGSPTSSIGISDTGTAIWTFGNGVALGGATAASITGTGTKPTTTSGTGVHP